MLNSKAFIGLGLLSLLATSCNHQSEPNSKETTFVSQDKKLDAYVYLYSEKSDSGEGRCWHKVVSGKKLSPSQLKAAHSTPLTPEALSDDSVEEALKRASRNNLMPLITSTSGAAGSCAGAIAGVVATVTTLLTPGAQPLSPLAAITTATSVVGCGATGKAAIDALWNAYYYANLKSNLSDSDVSADLSKQATTAGDILVAALDNAKFHTTGEKCQAHN